MVPDPPAESSDGSAAHTSAWRRLAGSMGRVALAWLPFLATWVLFVRLFANEPLEGAVASGVVAVGNAALLGVGVWWLSGRLPWPDRVRPAFYAAHLVAGSLYSGAWIVAGHYAALAFTGEGTLWMLLASNLIGWRFLMGVYLYGLVAGVSYAVRMRRHLVEKEAIAARAEALAAEARLESLRAQLNPHFLFNALHTVNGLTRTDPAAARDAIDKLGALLHYSLGGDTSGQVTLAEEWEFAERYLDLERLRLGDRLAVRHTFGDGTAACLVPPFVIQSLVENAIRHGVAPVATGGTVAVDARIGGGRLTIAVEDDGAGPSDATSGSGRGLRLLRERLAALHGEAVALTAGPRPAGGFRVSVSLPAVR